jgi:hypothetical protein
VNSKGEYAVTCGCKPAVLIVFEQGAAPQRRSLRIFWVYSRRMAPRKDFQPAKGTVDTAWGSGSYSLCKNGQIRQQIRWRVGDCTGMAKLTKPGDDVSAVITAALINLPGSQPAAAAPEALLVADEGDAPR